MLLFLEFDDKQRDEEEKRIWDAIGNNKMLWMWLKQHNLKLVKTEEAETATAEEDEKRRDGNENKTINVL